MAWAGVALGLALAGAGPANASARSVLPTVAAATAPSGHLDVVQVNGLIDPIEADYVRRAVQQAVAGGAEALVVQFDSGGGVLAAPALHRLAVTIETARVPVAVWVGPNGSRAEGQAAVIGAAAAIRGVSPGARAGAVPPGFEDLASHAVTSAQLNQPTLGDFIVNLDGLAVGGRTLHTAEVVRSGRQPRRQPTVAVRFEKLTLVEQLLHTAASPSVAYLLLLVGLLLLALEFFTAGIGIAVACGTGALVLSAYGLGVLPIRVWALALLAVAVFGFCVDLQAGVPRIWSAIGVASLVGGTVFLYRGSVHASVLAWVAGVVGTPLFMVAGMPAMVRARFSTPTIGRQSLIGELGVALDAVEPEGIVEVRGAPWQARTNRATPIKLGERIRVVAIDGLLLQVEPESGGARDARH